MRFGGELCRKGDLEYNPDRLIYVPCFPITKTKEKYHLYDYDIKLQKYEDIMECDKSKITNCIVSI